MSLMSLFSLGKYLNTSGGPHSAAARPGCIRPTLLSADNELSMAPHTSKTASLRKCNVTDCEKTCICMGDVRYLLLKLHGVVMTIAFVYFVPVGALVSRYYNYTVSCLPAPGSGPM
ncbi:uncharacterized protein LOC135332556 [Halichondria panicea]|uniref:uncharacterized protein LOC135332556 n=1 Tax=Halichondria panicea TaxID=6063 RepID=UPI00312B8AF1